MKHFLFFLASLPFLTLTGQDKMPGGVSGARLWEITESSQSGKARWRSMLESASDEEFIIKGDIRTINHNPALLFIGVSDTLSSSLDPGRLSSFTLFTVCQETDTISERVIISVENDTAAEMVLTNKRFADLDLVSYSSYRATRNLYPRIYSYTRNRPEDPEIISRRLLFGRPPKSQRLPVSLFNGVIPEVILFNRVISPVERQKVESYLAMKYGISLNQEFPVSYLNSKGEIIWDAELNADFNRNIAAVGRDDLSGLHQPLSESSQTHGVMKIGIAGDLSDNSFLIWGDNGKPLRFVEESGVRKLQREWKISAFNLRSDPVNVASSELSFNEIDPLRTGESYWMMIDRSGTGKFPFGETEYLNCLHSPSDDRVIKFNSVFFDTDSSGCDLFTLITAPHLFARSIVQSPTCTASRSGTVMTEIAGGKPPFMILLKGLSNSSLQVASNKFKRDHVFGDISQGAYEIQVKDADGKTYTEEIWVSNTHLWETRLDRSYKLVEGETLILNASKGMPALDFNYSWTLPGGSMVNNEEIVIDQPGKYFLSVTDNFNCNSILEFRINQTGKSNFKNVELYPNPVRGWFVVRMSLERAADVNVVISDASGKNLKQTLLRNDFYYMYSDIIHTPGIYFITLITDMEKETLRLIVQ